MKWNDRDKEFIRLFIPIMLEQFFLTLMGNLDTVILSGYSDRAVAASGMANQILITGFMLLNITSTGTTIILTQLKARNNPSALKEVETTSIVISVILAVIPSVVFFVFAKGFLGFFSTPSEIMDEAVLFMRIIALSFIPQGISSAVSSILRSYKKAGIILAITVGSNILNLLGNSLVVFTDFSLLGRGVEGVAKVTLISRIAAACFLSFYYLFKVRNKEKTKVRLTTMRRILKLGIPSGFENVAYNFSQTILAGIIAVLGTRLITARIYTLTITGFVFAFSMGLSMALQITAGHLIGEGRKEEAFKFVIRRTLRGAGLIAVLTLIAALLSPSIVKYLTEDDFIRKTVIYLTFLSILLEPLRCINCCLIAGLTSVGDVKYPVTVGIFAIYLINLPLNYGSVYLLKSGLTGIFICAILDEALRATLFFRRWNKKKWMKLDIFGGD